MHMPTQKHKIKNNISLKHKTLSQVSIKYFQLSEDFKNKNEGSGEVAEWLEALAALPEDVSSVPSTHTVAHSRL